jgi:transaldolase
MSVAAEVNERLERITELGTSIWLDQIRLKLIESGELERLMKFESLRGVTSNPAIFEKAILGSDDYDELIDKAAEEGLDSRAIYDRVAIKTVQDACDVLRPVFDESGGADGFVSLEVDPDIAFDTEKTMATARRCWGEVDRPNVMIKIPGTDEGVPAIEEMTYEGLNINVTLLFSVKAYERVADAYIRGLERRKAEGKDMGPQSVASFFVSRVDTEVDKRLAAIGTDEAEGLKSLAGVANARLAYELYEKEFATDRAKALTDAGAHAQRPLWASTGVKDPNLPDTLYVTELVAQGVVNTMPEKTLEATFDHGEIVGDTVTGAYADAGAVLDSLARVGVDYDDVTAVLEREGVEKFIVSWHELLDTVRTALEAAR